MSKNNSTGGICSPSLPDNHGSVTINCSGFSDKQLKLIDKFLNQLSAKQAEEQDILLQKMNTILEVVRSTESVVKPRRLSRSDIMRLQRSGLNACAPVAIRFVVPPDDQEASDLAEEFSSVLSHRNLDSMVIYRQLPPRQSDSDVSVSNGQQGVCLRQLITGNTLSLTFAYYNSSMTAPKQDDQQQPIVFFIYPKIVKPAAEK